MKKQIIITLILLAATVYITVVYFKNLNPPGTRTSQVMHAIPGNASLIFEFNNDKGFYDIFKDNKLFAAVIGKQKLGQLDTLRQQLFQNSILSKYFTGQNIFISLHPSKTDGIDLLFSMSPANGFKPSIFDQINKQPNSGLLITPIRTNGRSGCNIYINVLKKRFYIINKGNNVFSGSFSKELTDQSEEHKNKADKETFILLSEQQSNNSLANLYVNYSQLSPLFDQLFKNKNTDIFKNFIALPALATLNLNYRSDAIMFNGSTTIQNNGPLSYLNLFTSQQPVINHLKDIYPSTTAYSTNFSVSNPLKFSADLANWQNKTGLSAERDQLFSKIKTEAAIKIKTEFNNLLGNEFAIVTTRYFEKLAIISVKDGSKLKLITTAISTMNDENIGQLSYDKLPFFLLGDAFSIFRKPYFIIIDNYLILANSNTELTSYYDTYINRKFLSKNEQYNQFNNLLTAQSNVSFFFHFKNAQPILERDMDAGLYNDFKSIDTGWKNFYAASFQFTTVDKNFYTNFCMKLSTDTVAFKLK
jgi:CRISPR/Cas system CMR-associated protein Cmr5 small subunit